MPYSTYTKATHACSAKPVNDTLEKHNTPDKAKGIANNLIQGLNLSPDLPNLNLSGKEPIIGSLIASQSLATKNNTAIHDASIPSTYVQNVKK